MMSASPIPGCCGFFVERKKRFCKMIVASGNVYCGEHAYVENGNSRRRIPCPLDPKHTVFEERLSKHLLKCNSREKPKPVYYEKNINAGSGDEDSLEDQVALGDRSKAELDSHLEKLKEAVKALGEELKDSVLSHPVLSEELGNPTNGDSALKHLKQQASILGNMEAIGLLGSNRCFVEFGAGKGKLSHWIHEAVKQHKDYHFLLVERSSTRFKVDGKHQHIDGQFERLQVDIQHLDFSKVPLLRKTKVSLVGVGKHLCGAATDLALRCMFERVDPSCTSGPEPPRKRPRHQAEPTTPGPPPPGHEPAAPTDHDEPAPPSHVPAAPTDHDELAAAPSHEPAAPTDHDELAAAPSHEPAAPPSHDEPAPASHDEPAAPPSHDEPAPPSHDEPAPPSHVPAAPPSHDEPVAPPNRSDVCGVAIALCCHHRCEWRHYVGKQFFRDNGLGASEFAAFRRMSSWATCDGCPENQTKDPAHEEEHEAADEDVFNGVLSPEERGRVGRLCKLLINQGRVQYLQSKGFTAKLMYYTSPQITLENVLLTAVPSQEGEMCRRSSREFHP